MGGNKLVTIICTVLFFNLLFISCFSPNAEAFDKDTHYYLKYYLLRKVGFSEEEAKIIATADLSTDSGGTAPGFGYRNNNPNWHALASKEKNDARQIELINRAIAAIDKGGTLEDKLIPLGQYLHFLEDRTSHEGYGWLFGHAFKGHWVDYLSYYSMEELKSAIMYWLMYISFFFEYFKGQPGNQPSWECVKDTVEEVRDANPTPKFGSSPDCSKVKEIIDDALKDEIDPNDSIEEGPLYEYDKNGNLTGMLPVQQYSYSSIAIERNNNIALSAITTIEESSYFQDYPEASIALEWIYNFTEGQYFIDPSITPLRYAITNMTSLAQVDDLVLNATMNLSLLMLDSVFSREHNTLYILSMNNLSTQEDELQLAYEAIAKVETEIITMDTNVSLVNFDSLTYNLLDAWEHLRLAESNALANIEIMSVSGGLWLSVGVVNTGTATATDVECYISIEAPIMILGSTTETIITLEPRETEEIVINVLGLGPCTITVTIDNITLTLNGFLLGPFVLGIT